MVLRVSRILHAGYVLESGGVEIAFDPVFESPFSVNCYAFPEVAFDRDAIRRLRFAAVFISHHHEDHCSLESLDLLDRATPIYVFSVFEELRELIRALGFSEVHALALGVPVTVGPIEVTPWPALDVDVDSIFEVRADDVHVLNVVDAWIDPDTLAQLAARGPWDLVMWPFQTMRELELLSPSRATPAPGHLPPEWAPQLRALSPRYLVPSSCQFRMEPWSWYNRAFFPITYRQFAAEVGDVVPDTRVVRMNPGTSVVVERTLLRGAPRISWVTPIGAQDVDYEYDPALVPPSTAEIARQLPPLDEARTARVMAWCRSGLLDRLRALGPSNDPYFDQPRLWRLSVHHGSGEVTDLHYRVVEDQIDLANPSEGPLAWTTEIPATKLFGALEEGESLTSIYARIIDRRFDPEIEAELEDVDLLEDPLLRALYGGMFGAYQRAQLRRITARARSTNPRAR